MNPRMNDGGLLLASTATHNPLPDCALASMAATSPWERTPKIDGSMTSYQFLLTVAEPLACKKRCDRPRVFYPDMAFLPGTRPLSWKRTYIGELSLSPEGECLSLMNKYSTLQDGCQYGSIMA